MPLWNQRVTSLVSVSLDRGYRLIFSDVNSGVLQSTLITGKRIRKDVPVKDLMNIVADESILMLDSLFSSIGNLIKLPGRQIARNDLDRADMLLVRSVTSVNAELLFGTSVRFVGSATAGIDHIDICALNEMGVHIAHAPGCNAWAVVDYVLSAFSYLLGMSRNHGQQMTMGIIGCGQIGKRLAAACQGLGMSVIVHDPLCERISGVPFLSLDEALENSDVISLHVPLTTQGRYATRHMIGESQLRRMKSGTVFINASRGAVVNNDALNHWLQQGKNLKVVLDVWENEPAINPELLRAVDIGTPHIAGYSREGRIRGALAIGCAVKDYWKESLSEIQKQHLEQELLQGKQMLEQHGHDKSTFLGKPDSILLWKWLQKYDIQQDSRILKAALDKPLERKERCDIFDRLRKNYSYRREYVFRLFK